MKKTIIWKSHYIYKCNQLSRVLQAIFTEMCTLPLEFVRMLRDLNDELELTTDETDVRTIYIFDVGTISNALHGGYYTDLFALIKQLINYYDTCHEDEDERPSAVEIMHSKEGFDKRTQKRTVSLTIIVHEFSQSGITVTREQFNFNMFYNMINDAKDNGKIHNKFYVQL